MQISYFLKKLKLQLMDWHFFSDTLLLKIRQLTLWFFSNMWAIENKKYFTLACFNTPHLKFSPAFLLTHFFFPGVRKSKTCSSIECGKLPSASSTSKSFLIFEVVLTKWIPSICHLRFFAALSKVLVLSLFISDSVHHAAKLISSNDQCSLLPCRICLHGPFCLEWTFPSYWHGWHLLSLEASVKRLQLPKWFSDFLHHLGLLEYVSLKLSVFPVS